MTWLEVYVVGLMFSVLVVSGFYGARFVGRLLWRLGALWRAHRRLQRARRAAWRAVHPYAIDDPQAGRYGRW